MSTAALLLALLPLAAPLGDGVVEARQLGGLETRAAALMLSGQNGGDLPLDVLAVPVGEAAEGVRLALVLDVGGIDKDGDEDEEPRLYEVYVYVLEAGDRVSAFLTQGFLLSAAEQGGRRVKFFGELELAAGEYSLRLFVRRRGDERFALRTMPLTVHPFASPEAPPRPPLEVLSAEEWVVVRAETAGGGELPFLVDGQPAAPEVPRPAEAESPEVAMPAVVPGPGRRLRQSYTAALRRLAGGDDMGRSELVAVERAALDEGVSRRQMAVRRTLRELIEDLASLDRESLVPLVALYEGLYREHHERSDFLLATHAREMLVETVKIYAVGDASGEAGRLAACAMVSLGGYLLDVGSTAVAQAPVEEALKYDADQVAALGLLAYLYEYRGSYKEAADLLRRLVEIDPGDGEARLRLAINLVRLGESEAGALLAESLGAEEPWVAILAHQELARMHMAQGRATQAVALLEEARERWPESQRLHLQLAAALDRSGRPAVAARVLAELDPGRGREAPTPRLRYSRWPTGPTQETRRVLAAAAVQRRAALAVALDKLLERGL